jgi:hypothetical protein
MPKTIAACACVLAATLMSVPLEAQEVEGGYGRIPGWSFTPAVSAGVMFDSNIRLRDESVTTGTTESDQVLVVSPSGQLDFAGSRTSFSTGYHGLIRRYDTANNLDRISHQASTSLRHAWTRTATLFARHSYRHVPTTDDLEVEGVPFVRRGSSAQSFGGGIAKRLSYLTTWSAGYDETHISFDRDEEFLTGGILRAMRTDLTRRLTRYLSMGAEYALRFAEIDEGSREFTFQDAGGALSYRFSEATTMTGAAGVSHLNDRTADETRLGPYLRAGITHDMQRATIGASFERRFVPSFGFGGANATREARAFVTMPFFRNRLYTNASFAWRHSVPYNETSVELDTVWIRGTVGYGVTRWLRTEGFYTFTYRDSIVTGGEISRYRAGVQAVVSRPVRIR